MTETLSALHHDRISGSPLAVALHACARRRCGLLGVTNALRIHDAHAERVCHATVECFAQFAVIFSTQADEKDRALARALIELGARGVYVKRRERADLRRVAREHTAPEFPLLGEAAPRELQVTEHGLRFSVRLSDGLSVGLFLDQRDARQRLRAHCHGKRVLNLFCYTGSFSVAAAAGNAAEVTSVDLASTALARLDANIALNQQPPEQHRLLKADARKWLGRAVRRAEQLGSQAKFDRIVLDPPSFASSGAETFSVASDYFELAAQCLTLLKDDGSLLAVTNHRKTTRAEFETGLFEAARRAGREVKLEWINPPLDCPHGAHADAATKSVFVSSV